MTNFVPTDQLSMQLLHSVARKVFLWVQYLGLDTKNGKFDGIEWSFSVDPEETSRITTDVMDQSITIQWDRNLVAPTEISGSHKNFLDIPNNLEWFVTFEKELYGILEKLAQRIDAERKVAASLARHDGS